ncbi:MAG: class I SAM-dependent methyltransferase [Flavobacteriales bacterium]|nr:class I SAM-dependent methyltransferase [Flavobacteriales bacterium]MDW8433131.1 class I SAM-dependent methyltransferase [Flavobacteriales bacterium]
MTAVPEWALNLLDCGDIAENATFITKSGEQFIVKGQILRQKAHYSPDQSQTRDAFSFKWGLRNTFDSEASLHRMRTWLFERYGHPSQYPWLSDSAGGEKPLILDAGCGAGMSGFEYFTPVWPHIRYVGVDISTAVDVAFQRALERGLEGLFIQADLQSVPLPQGSVDVIFSEGVLHHTDSTRQAFLALLPLLKKGGYFMFYVYKKKGPIREFTDDYIRGQLQGKTPDEAWKALEPLTRLGIELGKLQVALSVPEPVEILEIPSGTFDLQRFIYWPVAKMFYREDLSFDEMNHINFDWYFPKNAHRHTPEEVRQWCVDSGLVIEHENIQDSGITIVARKT